jgi:ABC-2 type transport system permease protein
VKQRDGYHEKWDMDKNVTVNRFYEHYPQFRRYGIPDEDDRWLWYYAMQQMGDDESAQLSAAMRAKILQREKASQSIAQLVPTMHTQLFFNELAHTSLGDHIRFLDSTAVFHERLRLYFYPKIFDNEDVNRVEWSAFKPEYITGDYPLDWRGMVGPMILITVVVVILGLLRARKIRALTT